MPTPISFRTLVVYSIAFVLVCLALGGAAFEFREYLRQGNSVFGYVLWALIGGLAIWIIAKSYPIEDDKPKGLAVLPATVLKILVAATVATFSGILLSPVGNTLSIPDSMQFPFFSLLPGYLTLRLMDSFDAGNTG